MALGFVERAPNGSEVAPPSEAEARPLAAEPRLGPPLGEQPSAGPEGAPRALSEQEAAALVERIYRKHHELVFRLALRYGRGRTAWADDVMQDVFVDLMRALPSLRDLDAMEGWLYRATTHRCLKRLRRERFLALPAVRWILGAPHEEPVHPEVAAIARHDLRRALEAMDSLPPKERVAFSMFHLDGKSQDEIGEVLGHRKSYVCKLIKQATAMLRALGWEVPDGSA